MLPQPAAPSRPMLNGHLPPVATRASRSTRAPIPTLVGPSAQTPVPRCDQHARKATARAASATAINAAQPRPPLCASSRRERTRCAAAETATELVSATERFVEEFQAAEQRSESEQAGHSTSLQEQLQAVRMKVCAPIVLRATPGAVLF